MNEQGLVTVRSNYSVKDTMERLAQKAQAAGLTVFARIDHGANAEAAGMMLRPTLLLILGNPKAGTLLMQDRQVSGIDLPLKALAWQDERGAVWLTYGTAERVAQRHQLTTNSAAVVSAISQGLQKLAVEATT